MEGEGGKVGRQHLSYLHIPVQTGLSPVLHPNIMGLMGPLKMLHPSISGLQLHLPEPAGRDVSGSREGSLILSGRRNGAHLLPLLPSTLPFFLSLCRRSSVRISG